MSSLNSAGDSERDLHLKERNNEGEEDEVELDEEEQKNIITGVFGVIYTVSRERTATKKFFAFKMILDLWQLLTLILNPAYGWAINSESTAWYIFTLVQMNQFMKDRGLSFFLACFYIFVVLLMITVGICVWVAYSFKNKHFDQVWPIAFLRWFGIIFFQMLEIAAMNLILIVLNCQYFGGDPKKNFIQWEFGVDIFAMPYMINVVVAVVALILFTVLSVLFQMGEMELNMVTKNLLGMANSRTEVFVFLIKFVMTTSSVFLYPGMKWLSAVYAVSAYLMVYLSVMWAPYYYAWVNYVRSATYGAVLYSAGMLLLLTYTPGVELSDPVAVSTWQFNCTMAMWAGLAPAGLLGALLTWWRIRHFQVTVVGRFRDAAPETKINRIHKFSSALEVELASRCCRNWLDEDTLEPEGVRLAAKIIEAGQHQLQGKAYMIILYTNYLIDVQGSYQTGMMELREAKKADPSFLERFAIFCREQQHTQKSSTGKGKANDLVSYVEQQRNYRLAVKVHKESLQATSNFWRSLIAPQVRLEDITEAVSQFDICVQHAEITYKNMLQRNPENWRLMRMYAKFVEFIKNDPWGAAKWAGEAERLWQEEDDDKHNLFSDADDGGKDAEAGLVVKTAMEDARKAVVVMNAYGIIGMANKAACSVFGYDIRGLRGKNIKVLIPSPFAEQHDGWLRAYVSSPRSKEPLNRSSCSVALHHDRYVFGISLNYTKISGTGMDMMFLGIMEPLPVPEDVAIIWVLSTGAVISCDQSCYDWFGYYPKDLPGTPINRLVVDEKALEDAFKEVMGNALAHKERGSLSRKPSSFNLDKTHIVEENMDTVHLDCLRIKHKYASHVRCSVDISYGGVGNQGMFIMKIRRAAEAESMMIVTDRRGQLCHVSKDIAAQLGHPVPQLLGEMAATAWETLLPEPFNRLHRQHVAQDLPTNSTSYSCRSGLTVFMSASSTQGPELKPFKIKVESRKPETMLDKVNVVTLEESSMDQALDERCLSVLIDEDGIVSKVSDSPMSLFGFEPSKLLGQSIASFVDIFKTEDNSARHCAELEGLQDEVEQMQASVQDAIVELSRRYLETPAASYRVGVNLPVDLGFSGATSKRRTSMLEDAVTKHMQVKGVCPAVMQVKLHMNVSGIRDPASVGKKSLLSRRRLSSGDGTGTMLQGKLDHASTGMLLEIRLWKADLLTGVMQLDSVTGEIIATTDVPLCQPGLLLGVDSDTLVGRNIVEVLPAMRGRPVTDLFIKDFGRNPMEAYKKGGLKKEIDAGKRQKLPGAVSVSQASHWVDRQEMSLTVQAAHKGGNARGVVYVVIHLHKPSVGMPNLMKWLQAHAGDVSMEPASRAMLQNASAKGGMSRLMTQLSRAPGIGAAVLKVEPASMQRLRFNDSNFGSPFGKDIKLAAVPAVLAEEEDTERTQLTGQWTGLENALEDLAQPLGRVDVRPKKRLADSAGSASPKPMGSGKGPAMIPAPEKDHVAAWVSTAGSQHGLSTGLSRGSSHEGQQLPVLRAPSQTNISRIADDDVSVFKGGNAEAEHSEDETGSFGSRGEEKFELAGVDACDFRRGRRFKRIAKLLTGESTKRRLRRFKLQAYGTAAFILIVTIVCYVTMLFLLANQQMLVSSLNTVGHAAEEAAHTYISALSLGALYLNMGDPGLPNLGSADDIPRQLHLLEEHATAFQEYFTKSYYKVMDMPNKNGLHELWTDPLTPVIIYHDEFPGLPPVKKVSNYSMWDTGKLFMKSAFGIWQNADAYNRTAKSIEVKSENGTSWLDTTDAHFMQDNMKTVTDQLFTTLDSVVEIVIDSTLRMNEVQYVFLAVEGVVCCTISIVFMAFITTQLTTNRWILYNVFMMVPVGLTKALANKTLMLDDGDGLKPVAQDGQTELAGSGRAPLAGSAIKMSTAGSITKAGNTIKALLTSLGACLMFWRKKSASVSPVYAKRQLLYSRRSVYMLCSMFLAWGVMMIAINAAGHSALATVSAPIALFNLVNFVYVRHTRAVAWLEELAIQTAAEESELKRSLLRSRYNLPFDYLVMLNGIAAAPNEVSPHYTLATTGVAYMPEGRAILYDARECQRVDQTTCLPPTHPLYSYTNKGLDIVMQHFMYIVETCLHMHGEDPRFNSVEFMTIWNTRMDINGGLIQVNSVFYNKVLSVYNNTLTVHTVGLIMTIILMAIYILFILRPLLKSINSEIRRISELLNQLPTEVDVEGLVRKTQQLYHQSHASSQGGGMSSEGPENGNASNLDFNTH